MKNLIYLSKQLFKISKTIFERVKLCPDKIKTTTEVKHWCRFCGSIHLMKQLIGDKIEDFVIQCVTFCEELKLNALIEELSMLIINNGLYRVAFY